MYNTIVPVSLGMKASNFQRDHIWTDFRLFMQIYSFLENTIYMLFHISLIHMKFVVSTLQFGSVDFSA